MINFITDSIRFSETAANGEIIERTYNTYPYRVFEVTTSIQGMDYGLSNERYYIQTMTEILSPYQIKVKMKYKCKKKELVKRTDATIYFTVYLKNAIASSTN